MKSIIFRGAVYLTCAPSTLSVHFMNRLFYLFSLLWCGLFCNNLYAVTVTDLYEAELPIASQDSQARNDALPLALQQVLIKVTGRHQLDIELIESFLPQASRLTQQFRIQANPEWRAYQEQQRQPQPLAWQSVTTIDEPDSALEQAQLQPPEPYLLWVRFDEEMVNQMLTASGLPVWGKERPAVLIWLVVERQGERTLVAGESLAELQAQIKAISTQRGIPLWLPMQDSQEQANLSLSDLWGNFAEPILQASEQYSADAVVVARMQSLNETIWQMRWNLYSDTEQQAFYGEESGVEVGLSIGLHQLLSQLALKYAQPLDLSQSRVAIRIQGVDGLAAYARVSQYLLGLDVVDKVHLRGVTGQALLLNLDLHGSILALQQLLAIGRQLSLMPSADHLEEELHYQLRP